MARSVHFRSIKLFQARIPRTPNKGFQVQIQQRFAFGRLRFLGVRGTPHHLKNRMHQIDPVQP